MNSFQVPTLIHHQPDWDFYCCEVDDRPAIISLDLNLAEAAPHKNLPNMVYISIKLNRKSADGLPAPSELGELCRLEDRLLESVEKATQNAAFCGRVTTNGCRDLIFYTSEPEVLKNIFKNAMIMHIPTRQFELGCKNDPTWDTYFSFLFPNKLELNTIFNQRRIARIKECNIQIPEKQIISHTLFFSEIESRDKFILSAIDEYFSIESVVGDENKDLSRRWCVRISREENLDIEHMNALTNELVETVKSCGGIYDGWKVY